MKNKRKDPLVLKSSKEMTVFFFDKVSEATDFCNNRYNIHCHYSLVEEGEWDIIDDATDEVIATLTDVKNWQE